MSDMPDEVRRSIMINPDLYEAARQAAMRAGMVRGHPMSLSEWIREAMAEKLARQDK